MPTDNAYYSASEAPPQENTLRGEQLTLIRRRNAELQASLKRDRDERRAVRLAEKERVKAAESLRLAEARRAGQAEKQRAYRERKKLQHIAPPPVAAPVITVDFEDRIAAEIDVNAWLKHGTPAQTRQVRPHMVEQVALHLAILIQWRAQARRMPSLAEFAKAISEHTGTAIDRYQARNILRRLEAIRGHDPQVQRG